MLDIQSFVFNRPCEDGALVMKQVVLGIAIYLLVLFENRVIRIMFELMAEEMG